MEDQEHNMTYHNFDDLIDDLTPEQKARVEALKDAARAEMVTYTLRELRRHRELIGGQQR